MRTTLHLFIIVLAGCGGALESPGERQATSAGAGYSGWSSLGGSVMPGVEAAVTHLPNGALVTFVEGNDANVYYKYQTFDNRLWTDWQTLAAPPPGLLGSLAAAVDPHNRPTIFVLGRDHQLWTSYQTSAGGPFTQWLPLGGYFTSDVSVYSDFSEMVVVGRGGEGACWARSWDGYNQWQWTNLGGWLSTDRPVITPPDFQGRNTVFVVGSDHVVYAQRGYLASWRNNAWTRIGGNVTSGLGASTLSWAANISDQVTAPYVFWRDSDQQLWEAWETAPDVYSTFPLGGVLGTQNNRPAIGANSDGRLEVYVQDPNRSLWHRTMTSHTGTGFWAWSDWQPLGGTLINNVAVGHNADGRLEVFGQGTDIALYNDWQTR